MAILRSRSVDAEILELGSDGIARALSEWQARIQAAREEGRRAGLAEAAQRVAEAEKRAAGAEAAAERRQEKVQQEFLARFQPPLQAVQQAATGLAGLEKRLIGEAEGELVRLALAIAAALCRVTIVSDAPWVRAVVAAALAQLPDRRQLQVRLHPADAAALQAAGCGLATLPGLDAVAVVPDAGLGRGACQLVSQGTRIDASLSACWERLAQELIDALPQGLLPAEHAEAAPVEAVPAPAEPIQAASPAAAPPPPSPPAAGPGDALPAVADAAPASGGSAAAAAGAAP